MNMKNIHASRHWFEVLQTTDKSQTAVMTLGPGKATGKKAEIHSHSNQTLLVVTGCIKGTVGEEQLALAAGDVIIIPAGTLHHFWNDGDEPATTFNVYSPPEYPPDCKD